MSKLEDQQLYLRAKDILDHPESDWGALSQAVAMLEKAYRSGLRKAGWDIVLLGWELRDAAGLSNQEQVELLLELAKRGNPTAALDLFYRLGSEVDEDRLVEALVAVSPRSAEAEEILARLRTNKH